MRSLDRQLRGVRGVRSPPPAARCTGRATPTRRTRSSSPSRAATARTEVVKVKSLATDEIGLNDALAAAGVDAIETDFAELILQLDGDRPSHILVPAIHRNRTEIRDLFRRTIGDAELTRRSVAAGRDRAPAPARAVPAGARRRSAGPTSPWPRRARVVVLESEGNGRMCTTLPDVLISVMGIEKLVPRWQDLEVFLQLLPRSSTGERMNPYTSVWSGPCGGRRAARDARHPAGQRTHARARGRGWPPGAALHPLLGVPQRLPGVRAYGRPRVRIGLPGADRRDPDAAAARGSTARPRCPSRRACAAPARRHAR